MKKNGFVLIETLIATTLIATVFTVLYLEFGKINENYKNTYNNNSVEKLYAANNFKSFILGNGYNDLTPLDSYIDLTTCAQVTNTSQCTNLVNVLEVKKILFLKDDVNTLKTTMLNDNSISDNLKKFIKNLNYVSVPNGYRLIIEFNDGKCASIRM